MPALSLSHSTRAVLLHPPAPTASPAHPCLPLPPCSLFRSPSLSVPTGPTALPPPAPLSRLSPSSSIYTISLLSCFSLPHHVDSRATFSFPPLCPLSPSVPSDYVLSRSVVLGSHLRTTYVPRSRFSPSPPLPARVIKFCLRAFVSQLPLSALSKFILTLLHSSLALSHRDLLLHLAFSYLSARLSFRLAVPRYVPAVFPSIILHFNVLIIARERRKVIFSPKSNFTLINYYNHYVSLII